MAVTKIPEEQQYETWLKTQIDESSIPDYKKYLRRCIEILESNKISLDTIVSLYRNNKDNSYLLEQLDLCNSLLVQANVSSQRLSGFKKYAAYLLGTGKINKNIFSDAIIKLIFADEFYKKKVKQRFVTDSRKGYPMKALIPLFRKHQLPIDDTIQEACSNLVILTEVGVLHLKCISSILFVSKDQGKTAEVFVVVKEFGTALRVFGYLSPKSETYEKNNHIIAPIVVKFTSTKSDATDELNQLTREHYPEISHVLRITKHPNLDKAYNYYKSKTLDSQTEEFFSKVLDEVNKIEGIITYSLMLDSDNKGKGNGKGAKKKL